MRRLVSVLLVILFLHIVYGFYISFWSPDFSSPQVKSQSAPRKFFDYSGCINVKTSVSTGSGDFSEISTAARNAQVDFLITNDVNDYDLSTEAEGYLNNVLLIIGGDYGYLEGRILNFNIKDRDHLQGPGRTQTILADLLSQPLHNRNSGIFVLAHPLKPGYQLSGPIPVGLDGVELMNLKDVWQRAWLGSKLSFFWNLLVYPFNSKLAFLRLLTSYGNQEIVLWDRLNQTRITRGYFGSAAEAKILLNQKWSLPIPSYRTMFSIIRNHVLLKSELIGNADTDRLKITDALLNGNFYLSVDILQNPKGFEAYVKLPKNDQLISMGSQVKFDVGTELVVNLPNKINAKFETIIYKDGERALISTSESTRFTIQGPGVYRVAVRLMVPFPFPEKPKWLNWIITNPFYVH